MVSLRRSCGSCRSAFRISICSWQMEMHKLVSRFALSSTIYWWDDPIHVWIEMPRWTASWTHANPPSMWIVYIYVDIWPYATSLSILPSCGTLSHFYFLCETIIYVYPSARCILRFTMKMVGRWLTWSVGRWEAAGVPKMNGKGSCILDPFVSRSGTTPGRR